MDSRVSGRYEGAKAVYTTCNCNCGGNSHCVIKALVKDGKVVAVEPDDRYNRNVGREDSTLSEQDLIKNRLQRRPCVMGLAFHRYIYHPDRILYPLRRAPGSPRGAGNFVRISWDEAMDTLTRQMKETRDKYGLYSIFTPYSNETAESLFSYWGAGVVGWGWCSFESQRLMAHIMTGGTSWEISKWASSSAADMLANARNIILWGWDPTVTHQGPAHQFGWFVKLARERGKKVIVIDPRYSCAANTLADQWIPIKPGTDHSMFLAMAYVLFQENLWDREFVTKFVEPAGFEKWRNYVLGTEDGIKKDPEWAEVRCAVPAETIQELARLVGTEKPSWLWSHWSVSRKSDGEKVAGTFVALQAMLGNWGTPGAGPGLHPGPCRPFRVKGPTDSIGAQSNYKVPNLYRGHYWAEAVLLLDKVRSGDLGEKEYMRMVGWRADPSILKRFNPKFLFWGGAGKPHANDHVSTACNSSNRQVEAMKRMDFIVSMGSMLNSTNRYADIILPARDWMWEEKGVTKSAYGGFESINYSPEVVSAPGEVKSWVWVYCKIAERLGVDPRNMFSYYTSDENWEEDWERYQKDTYQNVVEDFSKRNIAIPSWERFIQGEFINCDEYDEKPFTGWDEQIKEGKPFRTESKKLELFSNYIADEAKRGKSEHYDGFGRLYNNLPSDWGDMSPLPTYRDIPRGMDDELTRKYPLFLLTSHSRYRVHYLFWEHAWLRNHVYRHRVWISAADAQARGIKDNDMVVVFNDRGKVLMPAYVTRRMMPGTILIHSGGKVIHDESGTDVGASPSTLLGGEFQSCLAPARATNLVEVEKYHGEAQ